MKIKTTDNRGNPNGFLIPVWSVRDASGYRPAQVYVTAVAPKSVKGPHLHYRRYGMFCCIRGNVRIVCRLRTGEYKEFVSGDAHDHNRVSIPPGTPTAIYNDSDTEALVLNLPSPEWSAEDPDEWPVANWNPPHEIQRDLSA